jgi:formate hydrogenlyase subunit 3/multisubunit Na+/H+ antiporter MnhD subunit
MLQTAIPLAAATAGGGLLVAAVMLPVAGILMSLLFGGRCPERTAMLILPVNLAIALIVSIAIWQSGEPLAYVVGGWLPPLGIALRADGLSAVMMVTTAAVACAIAVYARADFLTPPDTREARLPFVFWPLLFGVCCAMNLVCVGGDLFTLYVAMELLTFAAVPLVSLDGRAETLRAALRYLLFAIAGSLFYLLGIALLYGIYATLDITRLSQLVRPDFATISTLALMTTGLLAKTALFPLHLWLPPAHAGAPPAASATLSALVVKGSFFLLIRLWFDVMPALPERDGTLILGTLGAAAIVFGGVMALRQTRLKLLVAYSTVAQIGYLFLIFPLALDADSTRLESGAALAGGMLQVVSHATAKAGMFMAAGTIYAAFGHDRITHLAGAGRALPISVLAFACGGCTLIGLPPGGAFLAKSLLLESPTASAQWWWDWIMFAGSILTSAYVVAVLLQTLTPLHPSPAMRRGVPRYQEATALVLAFSSLVLGIAVFGAHDIIRIGRPNEPFAAVDALRMSDVFSAPAMLKALAPVLLGAALAVALTQRDRKQRTPAARVAPSYKRSLVMRVLDGTDDALRHWPVGSTCLLFLAIALGAAMLAAH